MRCVQIVEKIILLSKSIRILFYCLNQIIFSWSYLQTHGKQSDPARYLCEDHLNELPNWPTYCVRIRSPRRASRSSCHEVILARVTSTISLIIFTQVSLPITSPNLFSECNLGNQLDNVACFYQRRSTCHDILGQRLLGRDPRLDLSDWQLNVCW